MSKHVGIIGALDTKSTDIAFVRDLIKKRGLEPVVIDIGVLGDPPFNPDIANHEVAKAGGSNIEQLRRNKNKAEAMKVMSQGLVTVVRQLFEDGRIDGVLSMGGSNATAIATAAMRELPIGVPKVMVSTVAGGDVSSYVGISDIVMMPSIVDVAGINRISQVIYTNAVGAIVGMVEQEAEGSAETKPMIAASMFGNTTKCVEQARANFEREGYETVVFHAVGTGGRTMEKLIKEKYFVGVFDITTTELADEVCGGILSAGPDRLMGASITGVPAVIAPGCVDMVNFGPRDTVPEKYKDRKLYEWNPNVTLMRTNQEENAKIGELIAIAANAAKGPVAILLPLRGLSMLDSEGNEFWDPNADQACFEAIKNKIRSDIPVLELDNNINDKEFADKASAVLLEMLKG